jgi:hypothetical protein
VNGNTGDSGGLQPLTGKIDCLLSGFLVWFMVNQICIFAHRDKKADLEQGFSIWLSNYK